MTPLASCGLQVQAFEPNRARGRRTKTEREVGLARLAGYALALVTALAANAPASATAFMVGNGQKYNAPTQVAQLLPRGDNVKMRAGAYYDCTVWATNNITIEGAGPGVILTDTTCQGKAIF